MSLFFYLPKDKSADLLTQKIREQGKKSGARMLWLKKDPTLIRTNKCGLVETLRDLPRASILVIDSLESGFNEMPEKVLQAMRNRSGDSLTIRIVTPEMVIQPDNESSLAPIEAMVTIAKKVRSGEGTVRFGSQALSQDKIDRIKQLRFEGVSYTKISKEIGCARSTVLKYGKGCKPEKKEEIAKPFDDFDTVYFDWKSFELTGVEKSCLFFTYFRKFMQHQRKTSTASTYARDIKCFTEYLKDFEKLKFKHPLEITEAHAQDFYDYIRHRFTKDSIVRRILASNSAFFSFCMKRGYLERNVFLLLKWPKRSNKIIETVPAELEEFKAILAEIKKDFDRVEAPMMKRLAHRNYVMMWLLGRVGMRVKALVSIRKMDVQTRYDQTTVKLYAKSSDFYERALDAESARMLNKYIDQYHADSDKEAPIFSTKTEKPMYRHEFNKMLQKYCERAGVKKSLTAHSFRVLFAVEETKAGTPLAELQHLMNHSSPDQTAAYVKMAKRYDKPEWMKSFNNEF